MTRDTPTVAERIAGQGKLAKQRKEAAKRDAERKQHARIYYDLLDAPAWRVISPSARGFFIDARRKLDGSNNGNISLVLSELRHYGYRSPTTLAKMLFQLQSIGLIEKTRAGCVERGLRICSLYAFTDLPIPGFDDLGIAKRGPSFAYLNYTTLAAAKVALAEGMASLREAAAERNRATRKTPLQEVEHAAPADGAKATFVAPVFENAESASLQILESGTRVSKKRKRLSAKGKPPLSASEASTLPRLQKMESFIGSREGAPAERVTPARASPVVEEIKGAGKKLARLEASAESATSAMPQSVMAGVADVAPPAGGASSAPIGLAEDF
jgi:hypothetical protein